jgi:hypothetical protein
MLSKEVRSALEAELEALRVRRARLTERLDVKIQAIEAVLALEEEPAEAWPTTTVQSWATAAAAVAAKKQEAEAEVSFRDRIRAALAERPGSTPPEVATYLEKAGVSVSGTTPLRTRIGNEMFRMYERGFLAKRENRYWIAPDTTETARSS